MRLRSLSSRPALWRAVLTSSVLLASCGDKSPLLSLVRVGPEAAGAHCPAGGTVIESGKDTDRDGELDDGEVDATRTRYVCNVPQAAALVRVLAEPAGAHCTYGGSAVQSGLDRDGNGELDAGEVDATQYVCSSQMDAAVHVGDLIIRSPDELAQLEGIEVVAGDLSIFLMPETFPQLSLPRLQEVRGKLTVVSQSIHPAGTPEDALSVRLPALRAASGLAVQLDGVGVLDLTSLERVDGDLRLFDTGALTTVELPALQRVDGELSLFDAHQVQTLRAPLLAHATLAAFIFNLGLEQVDLPALSSVEGDLRVEDDGALAALSLPALTRLGALSIRNNAVLAELALPALVESRSIRIAGNAALSECTPLALEARLRTAGSVSTVERSGNLPDARCAANSDATCATLTVAGSPSAYRLCLVPRSFPEGRADCQALGTGADLAVFESEEEATQVQRLAFTLQDAIITFRPLSLYTPWVGYSDQATEGTWAWVSGATGFLPAAGDTSFWGPYAPSDASGAEDCAHLLDWSGVVSAGKADDADCAAPRPLLCEVPAP